MPIQHVTDEYVIPRGRAYFDAFDDAGAVQGEDDMGNCPSVSLTIETEKALHYKSTTGIREKDKSTIVQINRTGTLVCDNISVATLGKWMAADLVAMSQNNTAITDEVLAVIPGKHYQLGRSSSNPAGYRNISSLVVESEGGVTTYAEGDDYEVDLVSGRLQILEDGDIPAGNIQFSCAKAAKTWNQLKTGAVAELEGALRIIADNATGSNRDYYMPSVVLTPEGELPIITSETEYISMTFSLEVQTPANGSAIYLDDQPVAS
jgi:hypothetical protein